MQLLADQSLYEICIDCQIDIAELEKIESIFGNLMIQNSIADNLYQKLNSSRLKSSQIVVWKTKIGIDNQYYNEFMQSYATDDTDPFKSIKENAINLSLMIHKIDKGISPDDSTVFGTAQWIRQNTDYEPIIISDDTDLLTWGQMISSFFGVTIIFLSSSELFRLADLEGPFEKCCRHFDIELRENNEFNQSWSKEELKANLSSAINKGRLACHPNTKLINFFRR